MKISNVVINYNESDPLNGAFRYLQRVNNRKDINDGVVKITASTTVQNLYLPVVESSLDATYFYSESQDKSWYEIDFLQNRFYLESYVLRTNRRDFFAKWTIEGTNDGKSYDIIDDVSGFTQPEPTLLSLRFFCKYPKIRKSFRFVSNGKRFCCDDYRIYLYRIEFYGRFASSRRAISACSKKFHNTFSYMFMTLLA